MKIIMVMEIIASIKRRGFPYGPLGLGDSPTLLRGKVGGGIREIFMRLVQKFSPRILWSL